jgi:hypothetical protein
MARGPEPGEGIGHSGPFEVAAAAMHSFCGRNGDAIHDRSPAAGLVKRKLAPSDAERNDLARFPQIIDRGAGPLRVAPPQR